MTSDVDPGQSTVTSTGQSVTFGFSWRMKIVALGAPTQAAVTVYRPATETCSVVPKQRTLLKEEDRTTH